MEKKTVKKPTKVGKKGTVDKAKAIKVKKSLDLTAKLEVAKKATDKKTTQKNPLVEGFEKDVDAFLVHKEEKTTAEVFLKTIGELIQTEAKKFRFLNKISSTVEFMGTKGHKILAIIQHKYNKSVGVDAKKDVVKILGKDNYEKYVFVERTISLSPELLKDEDKLAEFIEFIEEKYGDITQVVDVKQNLYLTEEFTKEKFNILTTEKKVEDFDTLFTPTVSLKAS